MPGIDPRAIGAGHLGPLVPFARAFLRNDDDVIVVAPDGPAEMIADAGLDHLPYPDAHEAEREALIRRASQMSFDDGNDLVLTQMFIRIDTTHAYPRLLGAMRDWRPDPDLHMLTGAPHFSLTPAELERPGDGAIAQAMRFREEGDPARPLPDWWRGSDWPLVYLTFGSVAPTMHLFPGLYREALDALARAGCRRPT